LLQEWQRKAADAKVALAAKGINEAEAAQGQEEETADDAKPEGKPLSYLPMQLACLKANPHHVAGSSA